MYSFKEVRVLLDYWFEQEPSRESLELALFIEMITPAEQRRLQDVYNLKERVCTIVH